MFRSWLDWLDVVAGGAVTPLAVTYPRERVRGRRAPPTILIARGLCRGLVLEPHWLDYLAAAGVPARHRTCGPRGQRGPPGQRRHPGLRGRYRGHDGGARRALRPGGAFHGGLHHSAHHRAPPSSAGCRGAHGPGPALGFVRRRPAAARPRPGARRTAGNDARYRSRCGGSGRRPSRLVLGPGSR
ncbi:MAG: hypothetical protein U5L11_06200 [Arhodomonas sp.]|nr:hypothetical protein [Arhodomonas sp.]